MKGNRLELEDFDRLEDTMAWMGEHVNGDGYVLATAATVYWSLRPEDDQGLQGWPSGSSFFVKHYLAALQSLGCIELHKVWDDARKVREVTGDKPVKTTPFIKLVGELTRGKWEEYYVQQTDDPLAMEQSRSARLQARVDELEAQLRRIQGLPDAQ